MGQSLFLGAIGYISIFMIFVGEEPASYAQANDMARHVENSENGNGGTVWDALRQRIKDYIAERHSSVTTVARRCGVTQPALSQFLNGETKQPNPTFIARLAQLLGTPTIDELYPASLRVGHSTRDQITIDEDHLDDARRRLEALAKDILRAVGRDERDTRAKARQTKKSTPADVRLTGGDRGPTPPRQHADVKSKTPKRPKS